MWRLPNTENREVFCCILARSSWPLTLSSLGYTMLVTVSYFTKKESRVLHKRRKIPEVIHKEIKDMFFKTVFIKYHFLNLKNKGFEQSDLSLVFQVYMWQCTCECRLRYMYALVEYNFLFVNSLLDNIFLHFLIHTDLDVRGKEKI